MEKIEGKKDHFMIRVSKTDIEIRRIKDEENRPEYTWQYFNEKFAEINKSYCED